ncbi:D-xylulose reductase [compost metagenome]
MILADLVPEKLALFAHNPAVTTVDVRSTSLADTVQALTDGWGANVVFEASGSARAFDNVFDLLCPGGCLVLVGIPAAKVAFDIVAIQAKEARIESVFRYANIFPRALALIASGQVDVKPFISRTFAFEDGIAAFEEAAAGRVTDVKIQIEFPAAEAA